MRSQWRSHFALAGLAAVLVGVGACFDLGFSVSEGSTTGIGDATTSGPTGPGVASSGQGGSGSGITQGPGGPGVGGDGANGDGGNEPSGPPSSSGPSGDGGLGDGGRGAGGPGAGGDGGPPAPVTTGDGGAGATSPAGGGDGGDPSGPTSAADGTSSTDAVASTATVSSPASSSSGSGLKEDGEPCGQPSECESAFCVDDVCCNRACDDACEACSAELKGNGADGVCGPASDGTDDERCGRCELCDGGTCRGQCFNGTICCSNVEACEFPENC